MNGRIEELAEQCTSFYTNYDFEHGSSDVEYFDKEKFAQLIIQKCADIGQQYADGNYEVRNQILEHFGLEEE